MFPEICRIGPLTIYSYGLMLVVAFIAASSLIRIQARKESIDADVAFNTLFFAFVSGIIGARVFYVIENLKYYLVDPIGMIMLQRGGLSWFGGLIAGVLVASLYIRKKKLQIFKVLDLIMPFVALGQAIGRIGCLLNGCCYGIPSRFGIYFPGHESPLVPTQIYSSLILLLIFISLRFLQDRTHKQGQIFLAYTLLYSSARFFIEFWRAEHRIIFLGLNLFQIISILIFFLSSFLFFLTSKAKK
ncbi:MAG: prolipoprotein diacylglyceryl transferase [Candidatus Omnitrophica bacterium]|nr:prolipoprotein diacylglyceryl transferase [Candidatus Omnitrophota bacterium]